MKTLFILLFGLSIYLLSYSTQSTFKDAVLKANEGSKVFMNNESIEILNIIDSAAINIQIKEMNNSIVSFNANMVSYKGVIEKIEKKPFPSAEQNDLKENCKRQIIDNQKEISKLNEIKILLNKLSLTNGGNVISVTRTDKVTPSGDYIPEWFIIDNKPLYKDPILSEIDPKSSALQHKESNPNT